MIENISNLIVAAVAVIGAITAAILIGMAIWTFRDIRSRSRDLLVQILATVMVAVIPIGGILVYFMLRPRETLAEVYVRALEEEALLAAIEHQEFCPSCGRRVDIDMQLCPSCHAKLRNVCPGCGRAVHLSWDLCPYCSTTLAPELPAVRRPTGNRLPGGPPAARKAIAAPAVQAENSPESTERVNLLERLGGAIEEAFARFGSGKGSTPAKPPANGGSPSTSAPPPARGLPSATAGQPNRSGQPPAQPEEALE